MHVIRHADCRSMPWKNGGGVTTEILTWPPAAGLGDFDWRVSMAQVAASGPFSVFPGIDRTLTVLAGTMRLAVSGGHAVDLSADALPFAFPGDVATEATLIHGPVLDFNVMSRRGRFSHSVRRLEFSEPAEVELPEGASLFLAASGSARVPGDGQVIMLAALDTLFVDDGTARLRIEPDGPVVLLFVSIRRD